MKVTWSHVSKMMASSKTLMTSQSPKRKQQISRFCFFHNFSKCNDVSIFNFNIRKQHNTINMQISVYSRYRKQYITNGKN